MLTEYCQLRLLAVFDFISTDPKFSARLIKLEANGNYGPVAVHAAYLVNESLKLNYRVP